MARTVAVINAALAAPIGPETPAKLDELGDAMKAALANAGFRAAEDAPGN